MDWVHRRAVTVQCALGKYRSVLPHMACTMIGAYISLQYTGRRMRLFNEILFKVFFFIFLIIYSCAHEMLAHYQPFQLYLDILSLMWRTSWPLNNGF